LRETANLTEFDTPLSQIIFHLLPSHSVRQSYAIRAKDRFIGTLSLGGGSLLFLYLVPSLKKPDTSTG
jgi:hypothetical protein